MIDVHPDLTNRALGALLGQAVGDALGATVEFMDARTIARLHPGGLRTIVGGGPFNLLPGQVTDDTELALALAHSLADHNDYAADEAGLAYRAWLRSGPRDVGNTTTRAFGPPLVEDLEVARQLEERACRSSQANGSLMRASPLGVWGWCIDATHLATCAAQDSRLSHPHPVCQAACVVFTHAIAQALRTGDSAVAVFDDAMRFARGCKLAAPILDSLEAARDADLEDCFEHMGHVRIAFQNAFHQLRHAPGFEEGVVNTVMHGGDTDTNACIAGALLGSVYGAEAVPIQWREVVLSRGPAREGAYGCNDLPDLARRLIEAGERIRSMRNA